MWKKPGAGSHAPGGHALSSKSARVGRLLSSRGGLPTRDLVAAARYYSEILPVATAPLGTTARGLRAITLLLLACGFWLLAPSPSAAAPSQEDVFRSIQQNVGERPSDGSKGFALLLGGVGVLIMVLLVASRVRARQSAPRTLAHSGKLLREVMKTIQLKPRELKQLRLLADETNKDGSAEPVESPLTLLLCPSVLARTMKDRPPRVDRAVMAQLVRKMGIGK